MNSGAKSLKPLSWRNPVNFEAFYCLPSLLSWLLNNDTITIVVWHLGHLSQIFQSWPHEVTKLLFVWGFCTSGPRLTIYAYHHTINFFFFFVGWGDSFFLKAFCLWRLVTVLSEIWTLMWLAQLLRKKGEKTTNGKKEGREKERKKRETTVPRWDRLPFQ